MKDVTTAAKVGFVVVLSLVATVWMFAQVGQNLTGDANSFRVYAMLDDVSGLVTKSRVSIAGINVGQLDEVELVDGRARVWVRIFNRQDFVLRNDATLNKRQASLLGEYYLEITPGYLGEPLKDGDQIANVGSDVSPAELMNDLRKISQDVVEITQSVKRVVGADGGEQKLQLSMSSRSMSTIEKWSAEMPTSQYISRQRGRHYHCTRGFPRLSSTR